MLSQLSLRETRTSARGSEKLSRGDHENIIAASIRNLVAFADQRNRGQVFLALASERAMRSSLKMVVNSGFLLIQSFFCMIACVSEPR